MLIVVPPVRPSSSRAPSRSAGHPQREILDLSSQNQPHFLSSRELSKKPASPHQQRRNWLSYFLACSVSRARPVLTNRIPGLRGILEKHSSAFRKTNGTLWHEVWRRMGIKCLSPRTPARLSTECARIC